MYIALLLKKEDISFITQLKKINKKNNDFVFQVETMISRNILDIINGGEVLNNKKKLKPINNKGITD